MDSKKAEKLFDNNLSTPGFSTQRSGKFNFAENEFTIGSKIMRHPKSFDQSSLLYQKVKNKENSFMELMGYKKKGTNKQSPLNLERIIPAISVTDFMGKMKHDFFKKTGFLDIYNQCQKTFEVQRLIEDKNAVSVTNIAHIDFMRENSVKNQNHLRICPLNPIMNKIKRKINPNKIMKVDKNNKFNKLDKLERFDKIDKFETFDKPNKIDKIENILNKCDTLFSEKEEFQKIEDQFKKLIRLKKKRELKHRRGLTDQY